MKHNKTMLFYQNQLRLQNNSGTSVRPYVRVLNHDNINILTYREEDTCVEKKIYVYVHKYLYIY